MPILDQSPSVVRPTQGGLARSGSPLQAAAQGQHQSAELKLRWWGGLCVLRAGGGRRERGWRAPSHTMGRVGPDELSDGWRLLTLTLTILWECSDSFVLKTARSRSALHSL